MIRSPPCRGAWPPTAPAWAAAALVAQLAAALGWTSDPRPHELLALAPPTDLGAARQGEALERAQTSS